MQLILNGDTRPVVFFITSSTDHITGLTGATPTVTISKNGAAFASPAGTAAEIGNGWYKLTPSGSDATTNGPFLLHATASGGDPCDVKAQVVAFSPYDGVHLGLSAIPNVAAGAASGLPLGDASGAVAANNLPTLLNVALSGYTTAGTPGAALGNLVNALTESYATNHATATFTQLLYGIFSILGNITQSGTTLSALKVDGSTTAMTFTLNSATAPTSRTRAT